MALKELIKKTKKIDSKFKVGDYIRLDLKVPENWYGITAYIGIDPQDVPIYLLRAAKGIFTHDDLKHIVHMCEHDHDHIASWENIDRMMSLRGEVSKDQHHQQWVGKIMALLDECAIIEVYCEMLDHYGPTLHSGPLILRVPQSVLGKA